MTSSALSPGGRRLRRLVVAAAVIGILLVGGSRVEAATPIAIASQPRRPPAGVPGGNGACASKVRSVENPRHAEGKAPLPVWIFEPTGAATATVTGGRCNSPNRPAVFVAHGFGQTDPAAYTDLIEHLVSVGNVVVYPAYEVNDGERSTLEESYRAVDAGIVAAVAKTPRIDTSRVGWWGHSHGGGMIPWLVRRGAARGWGTNGIWMANVAQAYTQLVGTGRIRVPARTQAMTVAFEHDEFADNRLGIDVFESLVLPPTQKRHVMVNTDAHGQPAFVANHGAPHAGKGQADAVDFLLWRYADLLETCALWGRACAADLSTIGTWSDGTPVVEALVSPQPVDAGPVPALLAECDAIYGPTLNPRIERCGPTHI